MLTKLNNSAVIIGCTAIDTPSYPGQTEFNCYVVLAQWKGEFVTWRADKDGNTSWGRYFGYDITKAMKDYTRRVRNLAGCRGR